MEMNAAARPDRPKYLSLENLVLKTIRKYAMVEPGEQVLVAVSGGADSTALLLCLHRLAPRLRLKLTVAHLNHRIRGAEADADQEFVRKISTDLGLPFVCEAADVKLDAASRRQNLEDRARKARYEFLRRTAARLGAQKIAVGHTLNDQAETVILRLLRGSGVEGLSAIHPVLKRQIIRPLLESSRKDILRYLEAKGVTHREDSTNRDLRFRRNRVRHELIPYLEDCFNPRLLETLGREATLAREVSDYLESHSLREYSALRRRRPEGISLPADAVLKLDPALQKLVIRQAIRETKGSLLGITSQHVQDTLLLCRPNYSGHAIQLPNGCTAERRFEELFLLRASSVACRPFLYELPVPGKCPVPEAGLEFVASIHEEGSAAQPMQANPNLAFLDAAAIPPVLTVRSRLPGDRYGGPRHRKVKKMLIARRIDVRARAALPLVAIGNAVVWIPGSKPPRPFMAQPGGKRYILLEARPLERAQSGEKL